MPVIVLNTVVLPDPAKPTSPIFIYSTQSLVGSADYFPPFTDNTCPVIHPA